MLGDPVGFLATTTTFNMRTGEVTSQNDSFSEGITWTIDNNDGDMLVKIEFEGSPYLKVHSMKLETPNNYVITYTCNQLQNCDKYNNYSGFIWPLLTPRGGNLLAGESIRVTVYLNRSIEEYFPRIDHAGYPNIDNKRMTEVWLKVTSSPQGAQSSVSSDRVLIEDLKPEPPRFTFEQADYFQGSGKVTLEPFTYIPFNLWDGGVFKVSEKGERPEGDCWDYYGYPRWETRGTLLIETNSLLDLNIRERYSSELIRTVHKSFYHQFIYQTDGYYGVRNDPRELFLENPNNHPVTLTWSTQGQIIRLWVCYGEAE